MNNPNNAAVLRTLITYGICVPLAIVIGYLVTNPMDYSTFGVFGIVALLLASPALLRWHYPLLVLSWNMTMTLFFIKAEPNLWLVMTALSLTISVLERALNSEMHFIRVPQITWPLLCLAAVVFMTARLTGGLGFRAFGSEVYGGKKYVFLLVGICSYFALTARRIPLERAGLYVALFFLGGMTNVIADLHPLAPSWTEPVFWLFPPNIFSFYNFQLGQTRLGGFGTAGVMVWYLLMARYGIRGIFLSRKLWRLPVFFLPILMIFLGGYRSQLFLAGLIFMFQFFLEGLHRTILLPIFAGLGVLAAATIIPTASDLPVTFQRTLAFLPLQLDSQVRQEAQASVDWRVNMWNALLPQIPQHLLLGKGLAISPEEYNEMMGGTALGTLTGEFDPSQNVSALAYDYHSGPLSVILPFGIWGAIAFLWFLAAGFWVMYCNFRYGDPALQTINRFLFAAFLVDVILFMLVFGALSTDMAKFVSFLGLSVALNGGVCRPAPQPVPDRETFFEQAGALPRPQPRPAFPQ